MTYVYSKCMNILYIMFCICIYIYQNHFIYNTIYIYNINLCSTRMHKDWSSWTSGTGDPGTPSSWIEIIGHRYILFLHKSTPESECDLISCYVYIYIFIIYIYIYIYICTYRVWEDPPVHLANNLNPMCQCEKAS